MKPLLIIAILAIAAAISAGLLLGVLYVPTNQVVEKPREVGASPEKSLQPEIKELSQQDAEMAQQPPQAKANIASGLTYVNGVVSVRRAFYPGERCQEREDRPGVTCLEMPEQVLFSNPKLRDLLLRSDELYNSYQYACNLNELNKHQCAIGSIRPPDPLKIPITIDELNTLKAFFNSGPPSESREGKNVRLEYGNVVTVNGKVYLISFFTSWSSP